MRRPRFPPPTPGQMQYRIDKAIQNGPVRFVCVKCRKGEQISRELRRCKKCLDEEMTWPKEGQAPQRKE